MKGVTERNFKMLAAICWLGMPLGIMLPYHKLNIICGVLWIFSLFPLHNEGSRWGMLWLPLAVCPFAFWRAMLIGFHCASGQGLSIRPWVRQVYNQPKKGFL